LGEPVVVVVMVGDEDLLDALYAVRSHARL
jgi:hypothetical protein